MIDGSTYPLGYPIYTYVDPVTGQNTHIDAPRLRAWCHANRRNPALSRGMAPVEPERAEEWIRNNIVSMTRVIELLAKDHLDPVIFAHDGTYSPDNGGPNAMLVDGHHRFVLAAKLKLSTIPSYMCSLEQWKPFQVTNIRDLTEAELHAIPIQQRNY